MPSFKEEWTGEFGGMAARRVAVDFAGADMGSTVSQTNDGSNSAHFSLVLSLEAK